MGENVESTGSSSHVPSYGRVPVFPAGERAPRRQYRNRNRRPTDPVRDQNVEYPNSSRAADNMGPYGPESTRNRGGQVRRGDNNSRGAGRGSRRGGNAHVGDNQPVEALIADDGQRPSASRGNSNYGRPRGQYYRGKTNRSHQQHDNLPLSHTFNPEAVPFIPTSSDAPVRLVRLMDVPLPHTNKPRGMPPNRRNNRNSNRGSHRQSTDSLPPRRSKQPENPNAPLRERLKNRLEDNDYECMICCQVITAKQGIWSCKTCHNMFHISGGCIVNWARKSRQDNNEEWRCPACQAKYSQVPYNYFCFCGNERNPPVQIGETPHSCGQVCGGVRGPGCPHPCSESCHPGPCAECPVMITQKCNCGKMEKTTRCGAGLQISCEQACNRLLSCGNHRCLKVCHSGSCAPCEETLLQKCYCGNHEKELPCHTGEMYEYSCGKPCEGKYSCGVHQCTNRCHPMKGDCGRCDSAPERVTHCPCGKYSLSELGQKGIRTSCTDPVPVCESICNKVLRCGGAEKPHRCRSKCHVGPCPPCDYNSSVICRCAQVKRTVPCSEYLEILDKGEFHCERRCRKKKTCGVHKCQEVCCVQDVHVCMQVCNKRLNCGLHNCDYLCHTGDCVRCLQASFDEQFCHCGRTMRTPPIPCGTPLPECDEPCARPHACTHPVNHKCHSLAVCPPCTFLVERECYGKHEVRKNIPCHLQGVSCGRECGKQLPCGVHVCTRRCHFGDCLKPGEACSQPCSISRKGCEHPCNVACHGQSECPETPCSISVVALCECGRRREMMRCVEVEKIKQRLRAVAVENEIESGEATVTTLKRTRSMENFACLPCTDECKKVARNKKIAEALSIVTNDDGDTDSPMITFTETMKTGLKAYPQLVQQIENVFTKMVEHLDSQTTTSNAVSYSFLPMPMEKRKLIHEYASYFQLDSVSVDEVPKRSVIVTGKRGTARGPLILLSDLHKYPSVLKYTGSTTIRHNINDEIKKAAADEESGMKQLKANRTAYKRVAPQVFVADPVKQSNAFALLGSDDEGEDTKPRQKSVPLPPPPGLHAGERDVDWWSDEEPQKREEEEPRVDKEETEEIGQKLEDLNIPEDVKESCCDVE